MLLISKSSVFSDDLFRQLKQSTDAPQQHGNALAKGFNDDDETH